MNDREQLWRQLEILSRRVASLEARLNAQAGHPPVAPELPLPLRVAEPPPLPATIAEPVLVIEEVRVPALPVAAEPPPPVATIQPLSPLPPPLRVPGLVKPRTDIERLIGGRWVAAIGAVILVVGVGLGLKWAYDQGLLRMAPVWRCGIAAAFGFALLAAGEVIRKRYNAWAAVGVLAAGIGSIYASVFAAYRLFDLMGPATAFALLAATAVLGIAVGARARLAAVGVISLVAGYLTPLLFAGLPPKPFVLPAYLLVLLTVGLVLSGWLGRSFAALRIVVWFGTLTMGGLWAVAEPAENTQWTCVFLAVVWTAMHAELVWSARKGQLVAPTPRQDGLPPLPPPRDAWSTWRPLLSSFSTTAWAAGITGMLLHDWAVVPAWLGAAAYMVATLMLALPLSGHLRFVRDQPATDTERLGAVLIVQAAGLLFATIALAATGMAELFAWLALAVSAAVAGRWLNARAFWVYGLLVLAFATIRLFVYDSWASRLMMGGHSVYGAVTFSSWSLLAVFTAAAWFGIGVLVRDPRRAGWRGIAHACIGVGFTVLGMCGVHGESTAGGVAVMFMLAALAAAFTGLRLLAPGLRTYAVMLMGVGTFLGATTLWWRRDPSVLGDVEVLYLPVASFVFLAAAAAWGAMAGMLRRSETRGDALRRSLAVAAALIALGAFWLHERTPAASIAAAWTACAGLYVLLARFDRRMPWAATALAGLVATAALWAWAFPLHGRGWLDSAPLHLEFGLAVGLAIAGLMVVAASLVSPEPNTRVPLLRFAWASAIVLVFTATSFEVMGLATRVAEDVRVRAASVSLWWAAFAAAMIVAGFWRRVPVVRHVGLGLLAVAAFKTVILDLRGVPQLWRVIGFLGLGMLMLGIAVVYGKVAAKLDKAAEA